MLVYSLGIKRNTNNFLSKASLRNFTFPIYHTHLGQLNTTQSSTWSNQTPCKPPNKKSLMNFFFLELTKEGILMMGNKLGSHPKPHTHKRHQSHTLGGFTNNTNQRTLISINLKLWNDFKSRLNIIKVNKRLLPIWIEDHIIITKYSADWWAPKITHHQSNIQDFEQEETI